MEGMILGNRYKLLERIGGGGMAVVYKAKCLLLNRYVAVKILRSEFTNDEELVKRFRVEAQAAASLKHPNIVSIYDMGQQDDIHYIVMEYIDGITLKEYINQVGALPWKEAVDIAIQICSAIEQAHKNNIIHRDIKPHNIMITKEGIAKVTDFGIARAVTSATITLVGNTIGSVHYFSPEQARGGFIDEKSDLYSLGITIYEMVTGKVPFDGETPVAVALKHIQEKPERPININPTIPKGLNDLILKAIKKNKDMRYQTATEMLNDLRRILIEPDAKIGENNFVEDFPTKKMQAVGAGFTTIPEYGDGVDDEADVTDDEGEDFVTNKRKDRLSIWLGIGAGLIIALVLFIIGLKVVIPAIMPDNSNVYVVEDFTNRKFEEVKQELLRHNITAIEDERVFSDTIEEGYIISQDVAVGNKLKPGSSIKFTVSAGPELVEVPDVLGEEARVGVQILKDSGLVPTEVDEYSDTVGIGLIIRTDPEPLEKVKPDTEITVYVSLGPKLQKVKVPDVIGLTRAEAEKLILSKKLTIGKILPEGIVSDVAKITKQYPLPGTEVDEGTAVELTFGIEENEEKTPDTSEQSGETPDTQQPAQTTGQKRTKLITISLDPNREYGDEVLVYVESTPSDTNELKVEFNKSVPKSSFPFSIPITLAENGTTHIIVKLDGVLVQEGDY